jgi:hypothetical protein
MGVCVDDVLASVRGVVDLSPQEALDEAQDFLTRQGYSVTYRTSTTLTVERQVSDNTSGQESIFKLIVMALPQSGGGVRIKVEGTDREAVRDHQAAWLEWSETLPKRGTDQKPLSKSARFRQHYAEQDAKERQRKEEEERKRADREAAADQTTPRQSGGGTRAIARVLATILFVVGALLLAVFSNLIWTGDEALLAQIELGIWSMCFFLAAIYLKLEGR